MLFGLMSKFSDIESTIETCVSALMSSTEYPPQL